jgi:hemolysin III
LNTIQTDEIGDVIRYSPSEELTHVATHALGALLSVAGLVVLVAAALRADQSAALAAAAIYGLTLLAVYLTSALYHGITEPRAKRLFMMLDHCAIYLLIAGTYTPFALLMLPPATGWPLLTAIWACALAGVAFKVALYRNLAILRYDRLTAFVCVAVSWAGALWAAPVLMQTLAPQGQALLFAGGIGYTMGVAFYLWDRLPYHHAIWHLFVLGASACHYFSVLWYVVGAAS